MRRPSEPSRPHSPSPANPAFAPLYAREVPHFFPGGNPVQAPVPPAALSRQAHLDRLNLLTTRCELALVEKTERFAVCGIVGAPERDTFEFIMRNTWRLIAFYKSLVALENNPNAPMPDDTPLRDSCTELDVPYSPDSSAGPQSPVASPSGATASANLHPDHPRVGDNASGSSQSGQASPAPSPEPVHSVHSVQSIPLTASVPSVAQCPTLSPERMVRTLVHTATALDISSAGILPAHPSTVANPQTPSPTLGARTSRPPHPTAHQSPSASAENATPLGPRTSSSATPATSASAPSSTSDIEPLPFTPSHTSHSSHPSPHSKGEDPVGLRDPIPHSPEPDPPCPKAATPGSPAAPRPQCTECDAELCPSRIAVPIFTGILKRTQKCDGACRFCSPKRQHTCPYTLPRFRASPKA